MVGGFEMILKLLKDESGATAIEYGLIAVLLAMAFFSGVGGVGSIVDNIWNDNAEDLRQALN